MTGAMTVSMKKALVTGGSGEIGGAICQRLARDGFHVIVHANRNAAGAERLAGAIGEAGQGAEAGYSAEAVSFDVTDRQACADAIAALLADGPIQVLVNNAGIHADAPLAGMSWEQWRSVIDVSLHGFYNVTQPLLLPMIRTRWGRIVNISSVSGIIGNRGQANYAAAKAGLHGAARSLAIEVASRGITVNTIAPGIIAGKNTEEGTEKGTEKGTAPAFPPETIKALVPMQRAGLPEEVAALAAFLASEDAAYISGQVISINGAMA
ncbi:MAG: 3-oxoacyl-ACP reductase FabG [SAR324 cluster bacterium]|nr:3-oxoacyl-ACP reductase FabG [SAR324 cluster bacterium]MCH8886763.1 3-oxoacyl-ACP reductase FabG [SAR324 cluster bacterium]